VSVPPEKAAEENNAPEEAISLEAAFADGDRALTEPFRDPPESPACQWIDAIPSLNLSQAEAIAVIAGPPHRDLSVNRVAVLAGFLDFVFRRDRGTLAGLQDGWRNMLVVVKLVKPALLPAMSLRDLASMAGTNVMNLTRRAHAFSEECHVPIDRRFGDAHRAALSDARIKSAARQRDKRAISGANPPPAKAA
jgi:hypothetical protein